METAEVCTINISRAQLTKCMIKYFHCRAKSGQKEVFELSLEFSKNGGKKKMEMMREKKRTRAMTTRKYQKFDIQHSDWALSISFLCEL